MARLVKSNQSHHCVTSYSSPNSAAARWVGKDEGKHLFTLSKAPTIRCAPASLSSFGCSRLLPRATRNHTTHLLMAFISNIASQTHQARSVPHQRHFCLWFWSLGTFLPCAGTDGADPQVLQDKLMLRVLFEKAETAQCAFPSVGIESFPNIPQFHFANTVTPSTMASENLLFFCVKAAKQQIGLTFLDWCHKSNVKIPIHISSPKWGTQLCIWYPKDCQQSSLCISDCPTNAGFHGAKRAIPHQLGQTTGYLLADWLLVWLHRFAEHQSLATSCWFHICKKRNKKNNHQQQIKDNLGKKRDGN